MQPAHEIRGPERIVVLGASGMLGSTLVRGLAAQEEVSVRGTVRDLTKLPEAFTAELGNVLVDGVDIMDPAARAHVIADADVVVNAVGVVKQASELKDRVRTIELNALLPHQLAAECEAAGARFIHVSTDCVFSGRRGMYGENDTPDPMDFYGRSKLLGEVPAPSLTLRTSIIGHELQRHASLVDWFLAQPPTRVRGFVNAIYSGVTTHEFTKLLTGIIFARPDLTGLYHVASEPISKFDLLSLVADQYQWGGEIEPFTDFHCDRSMSAERLAEATGYRPPTWPHMVREMIHDRPAWAASPRPEELTP